MTKAEVLAKAAPLYDKNQRLELESAIDLATKAHVGQKRRSGEPYIIHPLAVADTLINWGMDIDTVLAGVLHDTVEDTDVTLVEIENIFGKDVAFLVDGVTKISQARAGMQDLAEYLPQTKDNLSKLLIAIGQDVRVVIIKLADRLHNLSTLQHMPREKQLKIARESLEVFAPMADRLGMGRVRTQMEELAFKYLDPAEYKKLTAMVRKRLGRSARKLGSVQEEVTKALASQSIKAEINGRVKGVYSLYRKLEKVDNNIDDIYDLIALRIIVETKEECYRVLGIIHTLYQPMITRIKDYIAIPKPNGYQSLHTTVITPSKQIVEFQIRTYEIAGRLGSGEEITKDQLNVDLFSDRIFVYSPKGDIYNLPEGALPLDFAYLVHSDIGRHAYSFKVNGVIHPFTKPLKNGDIVEVQTRKMAQPKQSWVELVKTTHARNKLRSQLRQLGIIEGISHAAAIIREKASKKK
jgi:guanosine-3',5'-bis(diphosphate) 3'-pyrophosphohydrolase